MKQPVPVPASLDVIGKILDDLLRSIGTAHPLVPAALLLLIEARIGGVRKRLASLIARLRAGIPARERAYRPSPGPSDPHPSEPHKPEEQTPRPPDRLPSGFGWFGKLVPSLAASCGYEIAGQFRTDPELQALAAIDPRLGRILRPLLRMLGIRHGADVLPPPPRRVRPYRLPIAQNRRRQQRFAVAETGANAPPPPPATPIPATPSPATPSPVSASPVFSSNGFLRPGVPNSRLPDPTLSRNEDARRRIAMTMNCRV